MRRRLLTSYLALTLVVLVVLEVPLALSYGARERQQAATAAERDAYVIANYSEETLEGDAHADLRGEVDRYASRTGARAEVLDGRGRVVAASGPTHQGPVLVSTAAVSSSGRNLGQVRITYGADHVDDRIHGYWLLLALTGLACLAAAAVVGIFLSRWVTQPLAPMRAAAVRLGRGDLTARVGSAEGPPEVQDVAEAFDEMADRLEELVGAQEAFVADASHQLRTPLTALRLRLENLEAEVDDGDALDDLAGAGREAQRLSRSIDGLLTLARADLGPDEAERVVLEVDQATAERVEAWLPIAEECQVELVAEPAGLQLRASPDRLAQVLDNLLANAIEASPPDSRLRLWAGRTPDRRGVEVHVTDQGPGLDPEQRRRAFDRFWRAPDRPRPGEDPHADGGTRAALGGSGLGLAIVARLVAADGGTVALRAAPGHGVDAVVRYPAPRPAGRS